MPDHIRSRKYYFRSLAILCSYSRRLYTAELARAAGYHPRSARYWESKDSEVPTNVPNTLDNIEQALERHGVRVFHRQRPGARLR